MLSLDHRGVAQSGSALHWGCKGHRFKSCRPDHISILDVVFDYSRSISGEWVGFFIDRNVKAAAIIRAAPHISTIS